MLQAAVHVFLGQLGHNFLEPGWAERSLSSEYPCSVLRSLIAASDRRGAAGKRQAPPQLRAHPSPGNLKGQGSFLHVLISLFFHVWEPAIKE